jgi:hypothetical protein
VEVSKASSEFDANHAHAAMHIAKAAAQHAQKVKAKRKCKVKQITARISAIYRRGKNRRYKKYNGPIRFMHPSHQPKI